MSQGDLYQKSSAGIGTEEAFLTGGAVFRVARDWSMDGRLVAFQAFDQASRGRFAIWIYSLAEKKATLFSKSEFNQGTPRLSPDGRWIAYVSNETGRDEIYVQPLSGGGGKWQLSSGGGNHPRWQRDGRQLFYLEPPNKMMAVAVRPGSGFEASLPSRLFETRFSVSRLAVRRVRRRAEVPRQPPRRGADRRSHHDRSRLDGRAGEVTKAGQTPLSSSSAANPRRIPAISRSR